MAGLPSPADMFAAIPTSAPQQPTVDPAAVERARQQQMLIDALTAQRAQQVNQWPTDGGPLQITVGPPANDPRLYDMPPQTVQARDPVQYDMPPQTTEAPYYDTTQHVMPKLDQVLGAFAMMPVNIAEGAWEGFKTPYKAYTEGMTQDEMIGASSVFGPLGGMVALGGLGRAGLNGAKPGGELGIFGGKMAKTADHAALARAEKMAAEGVDRGAIWNETGWFQGVDGKWRFEIPDNAAAFGPSPAYMKSMSLDELVDHPELMGAYPQYSQMPVTGANMAGEKAAYFRNPYRRAGGDDGVGVLSINPEHAADAPSLSLHELQHAVQTDEGFAPGGSYTSFLKDGVDETEAMRQYRRLAGETEARNVQTRMDMTPEQRRATPPWETQDVPDAEQIVRMSLDGPAMSVKPPSTGGRVPGGADKIPDVDYRGSHTAPVRSGGNTLDDLSDTFPDDIYSGVGARYYGHQGGSTMDHKSVEIIQSMRGKPDKTVTVYRAVPHKMQPSEEIAKLESEMREYMRRGKKPKDADPDLSPSGWYNSTHARVEYLKSLPDDPPGTIGINPGDWVTINKQYAKNHGDDNLGGEYRIISKKVKARDLANDGDIHEWGYAPSGTSDTFSNAYLAGDAT